MTKQEKIQEAYGEWFEEMKPWIDEDGWFNKNAFYQKKFGFNYEQIDILFSHYQDFMIPKSIFRLKDNNGWTKIESENDLPTDKTTQYSTCKDKKVFQSTINCGTVKHWFNIGKITHYQPIQKPREPLY